MHGFMHCVVLKREHEFDIKMYSWFKIRCYTDGVYLHVAFEKTCIIKVLGY